MTARSERQAAKLREVCFDQKGVYLCLLVNHADRSLRVVDFRAGMSREKRQLVVDYAVAHRIERLFTLVERDEAAAWVRLGFAREGAIPGFYKRSDAHVLGALTEAFQLTHQSGTRPALGIRDEAETRAAIDTTQHAAQRLAARFKFAASSLRLTPAGDTEVQRAHAAARKAGWLPITVEPFSRGADQWHYSCSTRGANELVISVESQSCFDNALVELLSRPDGEKEALWMARALAEVVRALHARGIVSCFALTPVTDPELAAVYLKNGFRRTGILKHHLRLGSGRVSAFLWSRKLAQPDEP